MKHRTRRQVALLPPLCGLVACTAAPATTKTVPQGVVDAPRSRVAPIGGGCPSGYPIKGNLTTYNGEAIYHVPGGAFYAKTQPETCFATEAAAQAAGYRRSQR